MSAFVMDSLVLHVYQIYSVFLQHKIPAWIWAPWRFVLHGHLPPSHMASIKPTVIISIQKWVSLTWTLAVLDPSDLKHTHIINKSTTYGARPSVFTSNARTPSCEYALHSE